MIFSNSLIITSRPMIKLFWHVFNWVIQKGFLLLCLCKWILNWTSFILHISIIIPCVLCGQSCSHVWLFGTPWTVAHQDPLSMGFSRQEYCSGLGNPEGKGIWRHFNYLCARIFQAPLFILRHIYLQNHLKFQISIQNFQISDSKYCLLYPSLEK